jgi:hypothetical protein
MLFTITRTSLWNGDKPPCSGATVENYLHVDRRTTNDPAKIKRYGGKTEWWYSDGTDHRVERGQIARNLPRQRWIVEIDDIVAFAQKHGRLVVYAPDDESIPARPAIEIYDGYRE